MYQLIQENKPLNPCLVHERELIVDLYNQATNNPGGPWKMKKEAILIEFTCSLCGCRRLYKETPEKTLL